MRSEIPATSLQLLPTSTPDGEADLVIRALRPIVHTIASSFGRNCEVILHDLRQPHASIVEIAGQLTDRKIGAPVNEVNKWLLSQGRDVPETTNKLIRTSTGRTLKSTAVLLRNRSGKAFGALCINIDVTELASFSRLLNEFAGGAAGPAESPKTVDDIAHVVQTVISQEQVRLSRPLNTNSRPDRLIVLGALEARGVFTLQRAVPRVAAYFAISRANIYSCLTEIRRNTPPRIASGDG